MFSRGSDKCLSRDVYFSNYLTREYGPKIKNKNKKINRPRSLVYQMFFIYFNTSCFKSTRGKMIIEIKSERLVSFTQVKFIFKESENVKDKYERNRKSNVPSAKERYLPKVISPKW